MYVARFSQDPEWDIERGWSAYFGYWNSLKSALEDVAASEIEPDYMEEKQQRWINTWGERYEDYETFAQEYYEELADQYQLVKDEKYNIWRPFHHHGLSCWALEAETTEQAMIEAQTAELAWGGFGQQTIGDVKLVGKVEGVECLYVFECEEIANE